MINPGESHLYIFSQDTVSNTCDRWTWSIWGIVHQVGWLAGSQPARR
jgi:hypothetical protein